MSGTKGHSGRYKKHDWSGKFQKILILTQKGILYQDIAKEVGLSPSRVSRIIRDKRFTSRQKLFKAKTEAEIYEKFKEASTAAADKIIYIMKKGKAGERIRLDAAKEVLNYAGLKPQEVTEHITTNYTIEDANSAKLAIDEISKMQERLSQTTSSYLLLGESSVTPSDDKVKKDDSIEGTLPPSTD